MKRNDTVWRSEELARQFLTGVRGAIPLADTQIAVMLQSLDTGRPVRRCLDLAVFGGRRR